MEKELRPAPFWILERFDTNTRGETKWILPEEEESENKNMMTSWSHVPTNSVYRLLFTIGDRYKMAAVTN